MHHKYLQHLFTFDLLFLHKLCSIRFYTTKPFVFIIWFLYIDICSVPEADPEAFRQEEITRSLNFVFLFTIWQHDAGKWKAHKTCQNLFVSVGKIWKILFEKKPKSRLHFAKHIGTKSAKD